MAVNTRAPGASKRTVIALLLLATLQVNPSAELDEGPCPPPPDEIPCLDALLAAREHVVETPAREALPDAPRRSSSRLLGASARLLVGWGAGSTKNPQFEGGLKFDLMSSASSTGVGFGPAVELRTAGFKTLDTNLAAQLNVPLFYGWLGLGLGGGVGVQAAGSTPGLPQAFGTVTLLAQVSDERGFRYVLKSGLYLRLQGDLRGPDHLTTSVGLELGGGGLVALAAMAWGKGPT